MQKIIGGNDTQAEGQFKTEKAIVVMWWACGPGFARSCDMFTMHSLQL